MQRARIEHAAHAVVTALEVAVMAVLASLVVLAIAGLVVQVVAATTPPFLGVDEISTVLDDVLAIFVLIELLATAVAYLRGTDVLRRIFEAVFIAIARKLITLDVAAAGVAKAGAVAMLLVAAAAAWWLVARSHGLRGGEGMSLARRDRHAQTSSRRDPRVRDDDLRDRG